ncbi:MAG TPA: hypothetical protein VGO78_12695 [Acidimicrobiales bacterium]|jgi:hypothetical protein|nr:hypothetical protein [Acidimicrobiales bacterium]
MPDLRDLLNDAVDRPAPLDLDGLGHRVARHQRRRRMATITAAAALAILMGAAALVLAQGADGGRGVRIEPAPPANDGSTTVPSTSATPSTTPGTTAAPGSTGSVPGGPGGAAPCAAAGAGQEGASVGHPERAPLQAQETFAGGVRWAVCGADPVNSDKLLNLRSDDGGQTWTVTDTGLGMSPFHAGDQVEVQLSSATAGEIHLVGRVAERDDRYQTADGGLSWSPVP